MNSSSHGQNQSNPHHIELKGMLFSFRLLLALAAASVNAANSAAPRNENLATNSASPPENSWPPFAVEWPTDNRSLADISFLLPAPAGKDGFIRVRDGRLVYPNGERFRIWGINATMQAGLPAKENASAVARQLAQRGLNCVRFHFLDRLAPVGLIDATRQDTRSLDPKQLERLDFFIGELKQRGIYADLNLNVGRTYKSGDGVRDFQLLGFPKALTYFDERLIELQKEYARQLLTHVNPYTGKAYSEEPAVAMVEFVNENSLVEAWFSNRLLGQQTNKPAGTWNDIPPSYADALTAQYNAWLKRHFPPETLTRFRGESGVEENQPIPRLRREQFAQATSERFHAEATFYMEVERDYFKMMSAFLRTELGVKALLAGNSDHNHGRSGYPIVANTSLLDIVDGHVYWQHPRYLIDPQTGRQTGFEIANTPMVDDPQHSTVVQLSRSAVAGKPYMVSEVNHPFPSEFACEGIPILAAYAALQDWDGIFWYTLAHKDVLTLESVVVGHFDFAKDPVKMSQLTAGALIFLRGDVRPALRTVGRSYTPEQVRESLRLPASEQPYFTPGFPLTLPLEHAGRVTSFNGPATGAFAAPQSSPLRSDTGELTWRFGAKNSGLVTVDTPRSQAFIGFCGGALSATENMAVKLETPFCAITLTALDDQPIASSTRLLLTTTARTANSSMEWNAKRTSLTAWGRVPTRIESVTGRLALRNLHDARSLRVQSLDSAGRALGVDRAVQQSAQEWIVTLGEPATTWSVISVIR